MARSAGGVSKNMESRILRQGKPHPYLEGYSVLPKLRKLPVEDVFHYSPEHHQRCLAEKAKAREAQVYEVEERLSPELARLAKDFLWKHYPIPLESTASLDALIQQMSEDVVIHASDGTIDWMAYGNVCLPSHWRPEEKIGRSLKELHAPVPGINLENSSSLVAAMIHSGPFERFIWSVVYEDELNFHPDLPRKAFDPHQPQLFIKVERQVTVGFPSAMGALFILQESLLSLGEIEIPQLISAIRKMGLAERKYKGLANCEQEFLPWLQTHF